MNLREYSQKIIELIESQQVFAMATIVNHAGHTPRNTGSKMLILADTSIYGTIGGGRLEYLVIQEALQCIKHLSPKSITFPLGGKTKQCCGGIVEVFIEPYHPGPAVFIFGAGHVGMELAAILQNTPFEVTLVDERENWPPPSHGSFIRSHQTAMMNIIKNPSNTRVLILTHDHALDENLLTQLLPYPLHYLGLIGSSRKWQQFQMRLQKNFTLEQIKKITCPIGLGPWGKTPKEVAISVAAQLLQDYYQHEK